MGMTKADYTGLANTIVNMDIGKEAKSVVISQMISYLSSTNYRFDSQIFRDYIESKTKKEKGDTSPDNTPLDEVEL